MGQGDLKPGDCISMDQHTCHAPGCLPDTKGCESVSKQHVQSQWGTAGISLRSDWREGGRHDASLLTQDGLMNVKQCVKSVLAFEAVIEGIMSMTKVEPTCS